MVRTSWLALSTAPSIVVTVGKERLHVRGTRPGGSAGVVGLPTPGARNFQIFELEAQLVSFDGPVGLYPAVRAAQKMVPYPIGSTRLQFDSRTLTGVRVQYSDVEAHSAGVTQLVEELTVAGWVDLCEMWERQLGCGVETVSCIDRAVPHPSWPLLLHGKNRGKSGSVVELLVNAVEIQVAASRRGIPSAHVAELVSGPLPIDLYMK